MKTENKMLELLKKAYQEIDKERLKASFDFVNSLPSIGPTFEEYLVDLNNSTNTYTILDENNCHDPEILYDIASVEMIGEVSHGFLGLNAIVLTDNQYPSDYDNSTPACQAA